MLFVQRRIKRAAIDTNTNWYVAITCFHGHCFDVFGLANISWVQSQAVNASLKRSERHLVLMMNVGDDWHRRTWNDLCESFRGFNFVTGAADNVATCGSKRIDLLQGSFNV